MPGKKEQRGAEISAASEAFLNSERDNFISFNGRRDCFLGFFELFRLMIKEEIPNNPERRGRRGSLIGRLKVAIPKNPAKRKIMRERRKLFSLKIRYMEMKIKRKGIRDFIVSYKEGRKRTKRGVNNKIISKAKREPYRVRITAL